MDKKLYIETYGCQMNVADSEVVASIMQTVGYEPVETLEEAVKMSYEKAKQGEAVLLSPACASWGMFPNYEVRGRMFKELVHKLKEL